MYSGLVMHYTKENIEELITQFKAETLPKSQWTHEAHIAVALWFTYNYDEVIALQLVSNGIINYNVSVGTENNTTSGYHETLTRFWLLVARKYIAAGKFNSVEDALNSILASGMADRTFPLQFYSRQLLFSVEARLDWIAPDIIPVEDLEHLINLS